MNPRLLWVPPSMHQAVWKNPPDMLVAAMRPETLVKWRKLNRWADPIPMMIFTDDDPPRDLTFRVWRFAKQTGACPHCVINFPSAATNDLARTTEINTDHDAARAYHNAVVACSLALKGRRIAWIQPESDHALGALGLTATIGQALAFSQRQMIDSIGALAAARMKVDVHTFGSLRATMMKDIQ